MNIELKEVEQKPVYETRILIDSKDYGRIMTHERGYQAQCVFKQGSLATFFGYGNTPQAALSDALSVATSEIIEMKADCQRIREGL